mgnify:CR=1 FL=1
MTRIAAKVTVRNRPSLRVVAYEAADRGVVHRCDDADRGNLGVNRESGEEGIEKHERKESACQQPVPSRRVFPPIPVDYPTQQ